GAGPRAGGRRRGTAATGWGRGWGRRRSWPASSPRDCSGGNRAPARPRRRRVDEPCAGMAGDQEGFDARAPAGLRPPRAPQPRDEAVARRGIVPHGIPDQRLTAASRNDLIAIATPAARERGCLRLGGVSQELFEEQAGLELPEIILVAHGAPRRWRERQGHG